MYDKCQPQSGREPQDAAGVPKDGAMEPLTASTLRGTWATLLLPLRDDESIDLERLDAQLAHLLASGVAGIYTNGTAGEFLAQSEDEFLEVSRRVATACTAAGVPFQLGASHLSPQTTVARIRATYTLAPSAYQVVLPDWVAPRFEEAVVFLHGVAEAAEGIGLVLYHPPFVRRAMGAEGLARLAAEVPALIGVKVMDGPPEWYGAVRRHLAGLSVFVPGHHVVTGLLQGAHGSYSNVACLSPSGAVALERMAVDDPVRALAVQRRLNDFLQEAVAPHAARGHAGPALDKFLAVIGGWADVGTRLRWPYQGIPEAEAVAWRARAREMVPELFTA